MRYAVLTEQLHNYMAEVAKQLGRAKQGLPVKTAKLEQLDAAMRRTIERAKPASKPKLSERNAAKRAQQSFEITFRGSGAVETIVGWDALCKRVSAREATLRVYMSRSKGVWNTVLIDRTTGESDSATVVRMNWHPSDAENKGGRPSHGDKPKTSNRAPKAVEEAEPAKPPRQYNPDSHGAVYHQGKRITHGEAEDLVAAGITPDMRKP